MIEDIRTIPRESVLEADVCVVGAGIAGLALVREFLGSSLRIVVLESGGATGDDGANVLNDGEIIALEYFSTTYGRTRGFGGTSELWAGQCTPMDEADFDARLWVKYSGWPLRRMELEEYYARAYEVFALPSNVLADAYTREIPIRQLAPKLIGLVPHYSAFSPRRYLGRALREELRHSRHISVLLHATVTELVPSQDNARIDHLEARSLDGHRTRICARVFVLCTGAIENARVLLASRQHEACGIGNRGGIVGRFLQDHVIGSCATVESDRVADLWRHVEITRRGNLRWSTKLRLTDAAQARAGVLNAVASVVFDYEDKETVERMVRMYRAVARRNWSEAKGGDLWYVMSNPRRVLSFGARHLGYTMPAVMKPRTIRLSCISEQAPNPESRIILSENNDALGMPRVKIDWRLTDLELRTFQTLANTCKDEFARIGLAKVTLAPWLSGDDETWTANVRDILHCAGTTRMASDSSSGVVDTNCKVFDMENLFVAGSSVFPTSGHANPVLTMAALSVRLADHLKERLH